MMMQQPQQPQTTVVVEDNSERIAQLSKELAEAHAGSRGLAEELELTKAKLAELSALLAPPPAPEWKEPKLAGPPKRVTGMPYLGPGAGLHHVNASKLANEAMEKALLRQKRQAELHPAGEDSLPK